eukprot:GHVN01051000.1.p2 GENE.GHVN01051000.1~~GHVN01051000.1.p2  ORF type:complete len:335 (-),score=38.36 GHVN01051000.1:3953-4957(-)
MRRPTVEQMVNERLDLGERAVLLLEDRALKKPEPLDCHRTHWDMVLQEVNWMALDFYEERKWKVHTALKLSRAIRHRNQAKEQAKETYVANRCSSLIQSFWLGVVDQVAPQCIPRDIQPYIMRFPSRCHVDEYQDAKLVWQRRTYNADLSPDQLGDSTKEDRKEEVLVVEVPQMSDCDAIDDGSRGGVKGEGRPFLSTLWTEPPEKGENNLEFSVTNDDTDTGRDQHTAGGEKFVPFAIEDIPKWRNQEYPALDVKLYEYCLELVSQECLNSDGLILDPLIIHIFVILSSDGCCERRRFGETLLLQATTNLQAATFDSPSYTKTWGPSSREAQH